MQSWKLAGKRKQWTVILMHRIRSSITLAVVRKKYTEWTYRRRPRLRTQIELQNQQLDAHIEDEIISDDEQAPEIEKFPVIEMFFFFFFFFLNKRAARPFA
jgi:hypothetical protein